MLFKPYHIPLIVSGRKTATRRVWERPHAKVGNYYAVTTKLFERGARAPLICAERVYRERLGEMGESDALKEGYSSLRAFEQAWTEI